jgi:hypothetical protein
VGVKPGAITLHIEKLVLSGFPPGSKHAIGDAVQSELMRLLHEGGFANAATRSGLPVDVVGGTFTLPAHPDPRATGIGIARRVHAAVNEGGEKNGRA